MTDKFHNKRSDLEVDMKTRKAYEFERYLIELADSIETELAELMLQIMEFEAFQKCQQSNFHDLSEDIIQGYTTEYADKKESFRILTEQYKVYRHIINNFDDYREMNDDDILNTMFLIETKRNI